METIEGLTEVTNGGVVDITAKALKFLRRVGGSRVGRMNAWRMVVQAGRNAKTCLEIAGALNSVEWGGSGE
jgi:hypothetical protein